MQACDVGGGQSRTGTEAAVPREGLAQGAVADRHGGGSPARGSRAGRDHDSGEGREGPAVRVVEPRDRPLVRVHLRRDEPVGHGVDGLERLPGVLGAGGALADASGVAAKTFGADAGRGRDGDRRARGGGRGRDVPELPADERDGAGPGRHGPAARAAAGGARPLPRRVRGGADRFVPGERLGAVDARGRRDVERAGGGGNSVCEGVPGGPRQRDAARAGGRAYGRAGARDGRGFAGGRVRPDRSRDSPQPDRARHVEALAVGAAMDERAREASERLAVLRTQASPPDDAEDSAHVGGGFTSRGRRTARPRAAPAR